MNVTLWPMKTLSSIVTPSQMNVWLEILQFRPTGAFFWISTNAPIFGVVADFAAVEVDELRELHVLTELHIRGNADEIAHSWTTLPFFGADVRGFEHPHDAQARHSVVERILVVHDAVHEVIDFHLERFHLLNCGAHMSPVR